MTLIIYFFEEDYWVCFAKPNDSPVYTHYIRSQSAVESLVLCPTLSYPCTPPFPAVARRATMYGTRLLFQSYVPQQQPAIRVPVQRGDMLIHADIVLRIRRVFSVVYSSVTVLLAMSMTMPSPSLATINRHKNLCHEGRKKGGVASKFTPWSTSASEERRTQQTTPFVYHLNCSKISFEIGQRCDRFVSTRLFQSGNTVGCEGAT